MMSSSNSEHLLCILHSLRTVCIFYILFQPNQSVSILKSQNMDRGQTLVKHVTELQQLNQLNLTVIAAGETNYSPQNYTKKPHMYKFSNKVMSKWRCTLKYLINHIQHSQRANSFSTYFQCKSVFVKCLYGDCIYKLKILFTCGEHKVN